MDYRKDKDYVKRFNIPYPPDLMLMDYQGRVYGEALMFHPPKDFLKLLDGMLELYRTSGQVEHDFTAKPTDGAVAAKAAKLYAARRQTEKAMQAGDRMLKLDYRGPDAWHGYQRVGEILMNGGKAAKGIPYFRRAVDVAETIDQEGNAYLGLSYCYLLSKNRAEALRYGKLILKLPNVNPNLIKYAKGMIAEAEKAPTGQ